MAPDHGITIDEQIEWLSMEACECLSNAREWELNVDAFDHEPLDGGPPFHQRAREQAAMLLAIENTLRAAQVSAVSPRPVSPTGSPIGPSGSGGFYPGD